MVALKVPKINPFHMNPIEHLGFPKDILEFLKKANILLVGDLLIHRKREVLRIPGIAKTRFKRIEMILSAHKLMLSESYENGAGRFGYIHPEYHTWDHSVTIVWPPDIPGRKKTFKEIYVDCVVEGIVNYV
jgi:hypothetical protein